MIPSAEKCIQCLERSTPAHVEDVRHSPPGFDDRHSVHILRILGIEQELYKAAGQNGLLRSEM
jgi:hypothetical protein